MPEPTLLRLSRITRVDLVDKGASYDPVTGEGAHVLIHKRAPVATTLPEFELPAAIVKRVCPACGDRMAALGVTALKIGPATPPEVLRSLGLDDPAMRATVAAVAKQGNVQALLDSFGEWAAGSFDQCVSVLGSKPGIADADKLCGWLKARTAKAAPIAKKVVQRGEEWCVTDEAGDQVLGCHDSKDQALAQLRTVEANKRAPWWQIVGKALGILKDEYGMTMSPPAKTFEEAFLARTMHQVTSCLGDAFGALYESIEGSIRSDDVTDKPGAIQSAVAAFAATVQAKVQEWLDGPVVAAAGDAGTGGEGEGDVEKIGRKIASDRLRRMKAAHDALGVVISEAEGGQDMSTTKAALDAATRAALPEPVRKFIEGLEATIAEVAKKVPGATPPDPWAGVSADVKKRIEDAEAKAVKAEAEVKTEREARQREVYIGKAAGFKGLPLKPDDDWKVLKAVDELLPAEVSKRVHELLVAGDAAIKTAGLFAERGGVGAGEAAGSAASEFSAKAKELVAKGVVKTEPLAIAKLMRDDPALYARHVEEQRARGVGR